ETPVAAANDPPRESARPRRLGLRTVPISEDMRKLYDLPATRGALVSEVLVGSPAHAAGIPLDAAIVEANGQPVDSPDALAALVGRLGDEAELTLGYYSRGKLERQTIKLDPGEIVAKPAVSDTQAATDAMRAYATRLETLESRIRKLEQLLEQLQQDLQPPAESPK
ncbi:MAG: PDZ domain-containing protein, partial [Planctomycetaceae bacterium]|nr:PDZ domain-containing protein [Planctomycetaceae bacterium]